MKQTVIFNDKIFHLDGMDSEDMKKSFTDQYNWNYFH